MTSEGNNFDFLLAMSPLGQKCFLELNTCTVTLNKVITYILVVECLLWLFLIYSIKLDNL